MSLDLSVTLTRASSLMSVEHSDLMSRKTGKPRDIPSSLAPGNITAACELRTLLLIFQNDITNKTQIYIDARNPRVF